MQKTSRRVLALILSVLLAFSVFAVAASAENTNYRADFQSETHTVFRHTEETLAPGVEYYNNYAYSSDGKQMVYYVTTADISRDDVLCQISYKDMQCETLGMSKLTDQVASANAKYSDPDNETLTDYERENYADENYVVVSGINGNGYNMTTGKPNGAWAMGGTVAQDWANPCFFAILKDGTAVMGKTTADWNAYKAQGIAEAINAFGTILVWDGVEPASSNTNPSSYYNVRHSRTMLGVTEDGKVVTAVLDGRQEPFSCGGSMHELAQIMLEAGCKYAVNLDGGGSSTFVKRSPGEEEAKVVNRPSDGSPRSISNGIIIASTAKVKDEVASVLYSPESEYVTPNTEVKINTVAYDEDGSAIARPSDLTFEVTGGTFENGVFTAPATTGDVTITAKYNGESVGEQVIHVVYPDTIQFNEYEAFYERLGTSTPISFTAKKDGNVVTVKPEDFDIAVTNNDLDHQNETLGSFDGFVYTAPADTAENQGLVSGTLTVTVKGTDVSDSNLVKFTDTYVLTHDFETSGRAGDPKEAYSKEEDPNRCWSSYTTVEDGGKVHSGNRSLALTCDFTNNDTKNYNTGYMAVQQNLGSFANCSYAKTVGMWIWIPESIGTLWVRFLSTNGNIANLIDTGELYQEKFENGAWHYFAADISGKQAFTANELELYVSDRDGTAFGYYFQDQTDVNKRFTIYIDDIGFDRTYGGYDFEDPIVSGVTAYTAPGTPGIELGYQQIPDIAASTISLTADVDDDRETNPYTVSGLDYSTAKAYIDGVEVEASAANNTINVEDITLSKGVHTVRFEIKDNVGCETVISRQFNITAGSNSALKLVSEKDVNEKVLIGSVRWFDLVADDISAIESADVVLDLDSFSKWQRMLIETADGFTSASSVDEEFNTLTLHFERTAGTPESNVLARIPVKAWQHTGTDADAQALFADQDFFPTSILVNTVKGVVTLSGGDVDTFSAAEIRIDTEIDGDYAKLLEEGYFADGKTCWHLHTIEWIEEPADGTDCLHPSHGGKGYCTGCQEIVYNDDAPGFGIHHYNWDVDGQQYVCKDCGTTTTEKPTMSSGKVNFSDGSQINTGWVVTGGGNYYFQDGTRLTGFAELPAVDGSGTFMFNLTAGTVFTGTVYGTEGNKVYENGILAKGRIVESGTARWAADADGNNVYDGNAACLMEYDGATYAVQNATNQNFGRIYGLWSGPANYTSNTTATTDTYYLNGQVVPGWKATSGVAYDENGNKVTGWRNADGSVANVDITDESTIIGKYYFATTGKLATGDTVVNGATAADNRLINFNTKGQTDPLVCTGYSTNAYKKVSNVVYVYGLPQTTDYFQTAASYTYMYVNGSKVTASASETEPKLFADGYYYGIKGGNVQSAYRPDVIFSGSNASRNLGMSPYWIEARYTGVIDDGEVEGYAIYGQLYEGYTFDDNRVIDNNGDQLNAWFVNGFGDNVYYKDGRPVMSGQFIVDGKAYTVVDEYGKAVPFNGITDGKFYIDGIEADNEVYADLYVVSNNKVCYVNEDGSVGDPVNGVIGESFFVDGVANELTIIDGRLINIDGNLYYLEDGVKGDAFTGLLDGVYYEDGAATEYIVLDGGIVIKEGAYYTVSGDGALTPFNGVIDGVYYENGAATDYEIVDGKYVFKNGVLYNIGYSGNLAGRVSGTVDGTTYASGLPQNGWVAGTYYYENGVKVTGIQLIDGVYYEFNDKGELIGAYNGMIYDEDADVYRFYDQGVVKNGTDDAGTCVDGVPVDGWYAYEYYFVDGKYLTGVQEVDGYYYDFGEDGKGNSFTKYTGIIEKDGKYYYAQLGVLTAGWQLIDDEWYYFSGVNKAAVSGVVDFHTVQFEFNDRGMLLHGEWVTDENGSRYYYGPSYYRASNKATIAFEEIDGVTYGFLTTGYRAEGVVVAHVSNESNMAYEFDADGAYVGLYTGLVDNKYYKDGALQFGAGLVVIDGSYYYIKADGAIYTGTFYVTEEKAHGLMPPASYEFGEDGKMILKAGIIDGYYYRDNTIVKGIGLVLVDGDYYYIRMDGHYYTGKFYVTEEKSNGLGYIGEFEFGADGKMIIKNGIVDGKYYVDNALVKGVGLVKVDGDYYYIKADGAYYVGKFYVTEAKSNGLGYIGEFEFGADGKMIIKNGIVDGKYYVDNALVKGVGLVEVDGDYYYIKADGAYYVGKFYITEAKANGYNDYIGTQEFGADGKMILD